MASKLSMDSMNECLSLHPPPKSTVIIPPTPPWVLTCSLQPQLLPGDAEHQTVVASRGAAEMSAVISVE